MSQNAVTNFLEPITVIDSWLISTTIKFAKHTENTNTLRAILNSVLKVSEPKMLDQRKQN